MMEHTGNAGSWEEWNLQIPTYSKGYAYVLWEERQETATGPGSCADGGAESGGQGFAEALDVGIVLSFDHNAGELLGARIT